MRWIWLDWCRGSCWASVSRIAGQVWTCTWQANHNWLISCRWDLGWSPGSCGGSSPCCWSTCSLTPQVWNEVSRYLMHSLHDLQKWDKIGYWLKQSLSSKEVAPNSACTIYAHTCILSPRITVPAGKIKEDRLEHEILLNKPWVTTISTSNLF